MTFNESNIRRDGEGKFSEKQGSAPTLTLDNRAAEIAYARDSDSRIAEAWGDFHAINDKAVALTKAAAKSQRSLGHYPEHSRARIQARIDRDEAQAAEYRKEAAPLREAAIELDKELYTGWNRFFLVEHIHSSQHCSSFRPTTRIGWLPNVSGLTEAEAVKEHGATLCTICFPSAPTELTTKAADDSVCTGTGTYLDRKQPHRAGYYSGNWGTCPECGGQVTLTSGNKLRKHKKGEA